MDELERKIIAYQMALIETETVARFDADHIRERSAPAWLSG
jgi:hypothetical protein